MRPRPNIELHIDELVLEGFEHRDRYAIAEAIERELARLFAEQSTGPSFSNQVDIARMNGGAFTVAPNSNAERIGAQVAQAIHGGITR